MASVAHDYLDLPLSDELPVWLRRPLYARDLDGLTGPDEAAIPMEATDAAIDTRPARVLVAEDDDAMRGMLVEALEEAGYRVYPVATGRELLACVRSRRAPCPEPDLVISDIRMPGITGLEVLRHLRKSDWTMPVIMITAFGDPETHARARFLGAAAVLDKPFDVDDLVDAARSIVPVEV